MKTIQELIAELDVLPHKVARQREELVRLKGLHTASKVVLDDLEADALNEVSLERNEADKPKYPNKEARESAVRTLLANKPEHRRATEALGTTELAVQNAQIQLGLLEDTQKSLYAQLDAARAGLQADAVRGLVHATLELARVEATRLTQKETP
jgi:hypothetical protein